MYTEAEIQLIKKVVHEAAEAAKLDAAYGGHHHDGGARVSIAKFETWLDGFNCGQRGCVSTLYDHIVQDSRKEADPEYQEYLKLKERFEK